MDTTNLNDAIKHYGVKGMKWDKEKNARKKEEERLKKERERLAKVIVDQANGVKTKTTVNVNGVNVKGKPKAPTKQSVNTKVDPKVAKALTDKMNSDRKKKMTPARKKLDNVVNKITDKLSKKTTTKKSSVPSVVVAKPKAKPKPTIQKYDRNPVPGIQKSITKVTKSNPKPTKKKKTNTKSNVYVNYVRAR